MDLKGTEGWKSGHQGWTSSPLGQPFWNLRMLADVPQSANVIYQKTTTPRTLSRMLWDHFFKREKTCFLISRENTIKMEKPNKCI